jgi:G3E family GTPase
MKVNLLFGFLGSGKTTLAKHLLAERGTRVKTAIIVNEFGEVGVDGDILRGNSIDVVELNSGCLCCTLRGSLMMAVEELRDKAKVERIIVEATGIAQPSELLESLADASAQGGVDIGPLVTVVDCAKFAKLESMLGDFYLEQIETADLLVANKIDLATPEQLTAATRRLRELNPKAELLFAEQGRVPVDRLFGEGESALVRHARDELQAQVRSGAHREQGHHHHDDDHHHHGAAHDHDHHHVHDHHHDPHADAPAQSFVVATASHGTRERVERFFRALPDNVWRAKGFIRVDEQPTLVQFSLGQIEFTPAGPAAADCVVFIGHEMDRPAIEAALALATR